MFELPQLSYGYDSLGQYLSEELMRFHHDKHHQTYVDKLNQTIDQFPELKGKTLEELLTNLDALPGSAKRSIINNGGGHYNHSLFWQCMSPDGGGEPKGEIGQLISDKYDNYQDFVDEFTTKALNVFGSGWCWLMPTGEIITTANQDTLISDGLPTPIIGLDVWEHAYYIDYRNRRDEFINAWWNIVDWSSAEGRYKAYQNSAHK